MAEFPLVLEHSNIDAEVSVVVDTMLSEAAAIWSSPASEWEVVEMKGSGFKVEKRAVKGSPVRLGDAILNPRRVPRPPFVLYAAPRIFPTVSGSECGTSGTRVHCVVASSVAVQLVMARFEAQYSVEAGKLFELLMSDDPGEKILDADAKDTPTPALK